MTGPACVLAFVFLSAFRDVFFADALKSAPFFAVALIAFATCTVAFLVVALVERQRTLRVVFADGRTFVLMNVFTAISWLSYFNALRFLEPAIVNVLFAGVGPLTIIAMGAARWRIVDPGAMTRIRDRLSGRDGRVPRGADRNRGGGLVGGRGRHDRADRLRVCDHRRKLHHHRDALRQAAA